MFTFVESRLFTRRVGSYLSDDEYKQQLEARKKKLSAKSE